MNEDVVRETVEQREGLGFYRTLIEGTAFASAVSEVPAEYWSLDEGELMKTFRPTDLDLNLKHSLWLAFLRTGGGTRSLKASGVYEGLCSYAHWHQNVLKNPTKLAWMLRPYKTYYDRAGALIELAAKRLHELLSLPVVDAATGKPDPSLASVVLSAADLISRIRKSGFKDAEKMMQDRWPDEKGL